MNSERMRKWPSIKLAFLLPMVIALAGAVWLGIAVFHELHWKQFAVVVPEKIYRSGLLKSHQLESAMESLKLKTVICLDSKEADRERKLCEEHGVRLLSFDMHSSGEGRPEDYVEVVRTLNDPASQPVLVHCRAGVARTGASVALYRMSVQNWTFDEAISELKSFERKGRCEPELQRMITKIYEEKLKSNLVRQSEASAVR